MGFLSLPAILRQVLGGSLPSFDSLKDKFLKDFLKQGDANAIRGALKLAARGLFKTIGAAMHPNTGLAVEQRIEVARVLATQAAAQAHQFADQILVWFEAQAARERARDGNDAEALAAREAAEEEMIQDAVDIYRAARGQDAREED